MTSPFHITSEAEAFIPAPNSAGKPITVIGTEGQMIDHETGFYGLSRR
jgi:hypothetical protein